MERSRERKGAHLVLKVQIGRNGKTKNQNCCPIETKRDSNKKVSGKATVSRASNKVTKKKGEKTGGKGTEGLHEAGVSVIKTASDDRARLDRPWPVELPGNIEHMKMLAK